MRLRLYHLLGHQRTRPGDLITTATPGDRLRGALERIGEMTLGVAAER